MRGTQHDKARSRTRIVREAARLAREHGPGGASVADVMSAAGMTHGGFYKHFGSKEALLAAALEAAFEEVLVRLAGQAAGGHESAGAAFAGRYLSDEHIRNAGTGCPIPSLAAEVGRGTPALKAAFGAGVRRMVEALAAEGSGLAGEHRDRAARQLAMMAGAVMIARASDPETADLVMAACRQRCTATARPNVSGAA